MTISHEGFDEERFDIGRIRDLGTRINNLASLRAAQRAGWSLYGGLHRAFQHMKPGEGPQELGWPPEHASGLLLQMRRVIDIRRSEEMVAEGPDAYGRAFSGLWVDLGAALDRPDTDLREVLAMDQLLVTSYDLIANDPAAIAFVQGKNMVQDLRSCITTAELDTRLAS